MKTPVGLVTIALTAAILLTATFLIATGTRGQDTTFASSAGQLEVQTVATGLVHPWALAYWRVPTAVAANPSSVTPDALAAHWAATSPGVSGDPEV